jgi:multidrug resistance efflux pump
MNRSGFPFSMEEKVMLAKLMKNLILYVLILVLLVGCGSSGGDSESVRETPKPKEPSTSLTRSVTATGRIVPLNHADLSFSTSGLVEEITVTEGQLVDQGTVLARLGGQDQAEETLAQAQYEQLQAKQALDSLTNDLTITQTDAYKKLYDALQEEYDAQRELGYQATDSTTFQKQQLQRRLDIAKARVEQAQKEYDLIQEGPDPEKLSEADARLKSADAKVKAAHYALDALELRAPFGGTVAKIDIAPGEEVSAGAPIMVIADLSKWVVETDDLTEIKVVKINQGQPVTIVPDALPDVKMTGTVQSIRPIYEEKRGDITYTTDISITEVDPRVKWGMTVVVNFQE